MASSISPERVALLFRKADQVLVKLPSGLEAQSVHSFRTTTRRLQTLLQQLTTDRNRNQKKVLKMLDRIRRRAGKVRDLDVQLGALRTLKVPQEPRRKTQLMHSLIELRGKQERKLSKELNKSDVREIRKRLKRAAKDLTIDSNVDPLGVARQMVAKVERPGGAFTEEVLHQYRAVVKRARYAAEFADNSPESAELIANLKRLQDAIGHWHDWLTLSQTATKRLGAVNHSSLVAALNTVTRGKFRQAVAALSASPAVPAQISQRQPQKRNAATENAADLELVETAA